MSITAPAVAVADTGLAGLAALTRLALLLASIFLGIPALIGAYFTIRRGQRMAHRANTTKAVFRRGLVGAAGTFLLSSALFLFYLTVSLFSSQAPARSPIWEKLLSLHHWDWSGLWFAVGVLTVAGPALIESLYSARSYLRVVPLTPGAILLAALQLILAAALAMLCIGSLLLGIIMGLPG